MLLEGKSDIETALQRVGEILASAGQSYAIVIIGGAALNLLGLVERSTADVDIVAFAGIGSDPPGGLFQPPEPLPEPLSRAAHLVARDMGLDPHWLNTGPSLQWRAGLPSGLEQRIHWRKFAGLTVGVVDRRDLILFKLFAAADSEGPGSVHYQDLLALQPTAEELDAAAAWVITQDASLAFAEVLARVLECVRRDLVDDDTTAGPER